MNSRFVGIKEFRQNMAKISERSRKNSERLIVLRKNEPIFELRPLSKEDASLEKLHLRIQEGLADIKRGRVYSHDEILKSYGLK